MAHKRTIPRLGPTVLVLGGGLTAGCGEAAAPQEGLEDVCARFAGCQGLAGAGYEAFVNFCVDDWEYELSFYDTPCQRTIRRGLDCLAELPCEALQEDQVAGCQAEMDEAVACGFDDFWW
jgi:hypothetical protein